MVVGITGSSGSGKSTVCELLEMNYDATIINADIIAKYLSKNGTDYFKEIIDKFGTEILLKNGEIDRKKLAEIIYNNSKKRDVLNNITFKYVRIEIERKLEGLLKLTKLNKTEKGEEPVIVIDAPLLFESKLENLCGAVICVICKNLDLQLKRIMQRDLITKSQAIKRLQAQKSNEYYIEKTNYTIINDGDLEKLDKQVEEILEDLYKSK